MFILVRLANDLFNTWVFSSFRTFKIKFAEINMIIDYFYPRRDIIIENFMASSLVKENLDQEAKLLCLRE